MVAMEPGGRSQFKCAKSEKVGVDVTANNVPGYGLAAGMRACPKFCV